MQLSNVVGACLLKLALLSQANADLPAITKLLIHPLGARAQVQVDIVLKGLDRDPLTIQEDLASSRVSYNVQTCQTQHSQL